MKYLILGDGKLSTELRKQTNWDYISRKKQNFDFTNISSYSKYLDDYDQIINCIGYTKTYENNKEDNWNVNYLGVIDLVDYCFKTNKKLIHISTDYVYANSVENASEENIPSNFNTWYSYTKLLGDGYVQAKLNNFLLIRTNFKPRPFPWKKAWGVKGNFDYIDIITNLIIQLIEKNAIGIYNVGTEIKSYYELAKQTVEDCELFNNSDISPPPDVTMNISKMKDKLK